MDQKYLENFDVWCWRRTEETNWNYHVKNIEAFHIVKRERNILHTIKRREAIWIGHILRRNCLLKQVSEGKTEGTGRWGRRHNQLLDYLWETIRH